MKEFAADSTKNSWRKSNFIVFAVITGLLIYLLFKDSFSSFFFQDDWFSLSISKVSLFKIFKFFIPRKDVIYYRPLGMQLPFYAFQILFGVNPLPFRIATFFIHLLNGYLILTLLDCVLKNRKLSLLGAIIYVTSATHIIIFYWAATFAFVLGPMWYFVTSLLYMKNKFKLAIGTFVIGLFTNEMLVTLPLSLFIYNYLFGKSILYKKLSLFFLLSIFYIFFRFSFAPLPQIKDYQTLISLKQFFINLRDYCLWALNWPDEIHNQFTSFILLNGQFLKDFGFYIVLLSINLLVFVCGFTLIFIRIIFESGFFPLKKTTKILIFGLGWFIISLLPVLFYSQHAFSYYLPIPLFGFILCFISAIDTLKISSKSRKVYKLTLIIFVLYWLYTSWQTIHFDLLTHWAPRRSLLSKELLTNIKSKYNTLPQNSIFEISTNRSEEEEIKWALGDQNALHVIYADTSIQTLYRNNEEILKSFELNNSNRSVFRL